MNSDMNAALAEARKEFFNESREFLEDVASRLSALSASDEATTEEDINTIFRALHSIKGGAGAWGFEELQKLSHAFETLLGAWREGKLTITDDIVSLMLESCDTLTAIIDTIQIGSAPDAKVGQALTVKLGNALTDNNLIAVTKPKPLKGAKKRVQKAQPFQLGPVLDDTSYDEISAWAKKTLKGKSELVIQCNKVERVTILGVQILISCSRSSEEQGRQVEFKGVSEPLANALDLLNLNHDLSQRSVA